jgi:16S rRNA (guanine966-N2)-methyltransferase
MTRVIAGAARGRRLAVPHGQGTRPTSDRAREGLFSTVESLRGSLTGARVLDLFAGSGAVGLEALSRGADHALLIESDQRAAAVLRANAATVGLPGAQVMVGRAERVVGRAPPGGPYDLLFADPPYAVTDDVVRDVLRTALDNGWVVPGGVVAVERPTRGGEFGWPEGVVADRSRRYGEGTLWYGRATGRKAAGRQGDPTAEREE